MFDHADFEKNGRAWVRKAVSPADLKRLADSFSLDGRAGDRPATDSSLARYFMAANPISEIAASLGLTPAPVRLAIFDKSQQTNWAVPWHQDRVIAVSERHDLVGHTSWLRKEGYWHVEPPITLLESMVFIRLHIDAADESNGCLQIALGSHKAGRIPSTEAANLANQGRIENCCAEPGDLLIVKALTLHRSASSVASRPRRAVRIDFADRAALSPPLHWALAA